MLRTLIFFPLFFHLGETQRLNPVDQELVEASLQGDLETIKEIISNHKLTKDAEKNPKIHWDGTVTTPLHLAAGNGHLNIVKFYQETLEEDISWFKTVILSEKKVKVTEFEDGGLFDWIDGLPGIRRNLQIKLRVVVDNKSKTYFSQLITKPLIEFGFITKPEPLLEFGFKTTEFPCFQLIQTTVL